MSNQVKIQYAVDEKMPVSLAILQALQHVIALFSSVVVVPVIVANATDVPREQLEYIIFATIIVTAVSTLIQAVRIGKSVPVISFTDQRHVSFLQPCSCRYRRLCTGSHHVRPGSTPGISNCLFSGKTA